jgi:hypothetical protein
MTRWLVFAPNRLSEWRAIILALLHILLTVERYCYCYCYPKNSPPKNRNTNSQRPAFAENLSKSRTLGASNAKVICIILKGKEIKLEVYSQSSAKLVAWPWVPGFGRFASVGQPIVLRCIISILIEIGSLVRLKAVQIRGWDRGKWNLLR